MGGVDTKHGRAELRPLRPDDVDDIVRFWFDSGAEFLEHLGVDLALLGTVENTANRFLKAVPGGDTQQRSLAFAITMDGRFAGYTLLNRYTPQINYSHWHITREELRGLGLSAALYLSRISTYFDAVPMERLIHETRTRNVGVNRMLDRYVPVAETAYVEKPDGVAMPGEFRLRYVFRKDISAFLQGPE